MRGWPLFTALFAMAAAIAVFCLSIAYIAFQYFGDVRASTVGFAFVVGLVIFCAASFFARGYRKITKHGAVGQ